MDRIRRLYAATLGAMLVISSLVTNSAVADTALESDTITDAGSMSESG